MEEGSYEQNQTGEEYNIYLNKLKMNPSPPDFTSFVVLSAWTEDPSSFCCGFSFCFCCEEI